MMQQSVLKKFLREKSPIVKEYLIVLALYALLTILLTYPMAFHVTDTIGGGDEAFTCWSLAWTTQELLKDPFNLFHANIFYPANEFSFALSEHLVGWAPFSIPVYLLTQDPVVTHNLLRLLTFVICGFGAYLLTYRYTKNRYAAFISGICFAFFSYRFAIQLHLLAMEWIPFMLLFLDRFFQSLKLRDVLLFTTFFLLSALSGWYIGIFTGIIVGIYFVGYLLLDGKVRKKMVSREVLGMIIASLVIIVLFLLPLAIPYLQASTQYDAQRGLDEPMKSSLSLDPIPIFQLIGYISVIFAIIGLLIPLNTANKNNSIQQFFRIQKVPILYAIIAALSYVLMIGPVLKIGGNETGILGPYFYIYSIVPFVAIVRDLSRFSFVMSFAVSILAGFGAAAILTRIKNPHLQNLIPIVLIILVIAGSWHIPVAMPTSLGTGESVPQEYRWLAQQPDDTIIIEIPTRWVEDNSEYTYYSTYHWKRMVNGYSGRDVEEASKIMRDTGGMFPSNSTISLLQSIGVKYVLIHTDRMRIMYNIPEYETANFTTYYINEINGLIEGNFSSSVQFVESFGPTYIYEVKQQPEVHPDEPILLFQSGWLGSNVVKPFYLKDNGKIKVLAPIDSEYNLIFAAQPISEKNNLVILVNGIKIGTTTLTPGGFSEGIMPVNLKKGFNEIIFTSDGCTKLCDIPEMNTISDRCISFIFGNLSIINK